MLFETSAEIVRIVDAYHHGYLGYAVHVGVDKFGRTLHTESLYKFIRAEICQGFYLFEIYGTAHI